MSDAPTSRLHNGPLHATTSRHEEMMVEARRIVDAGNDRALVLRLTGGLAVRHYAIDLEFAEREYSDIDLIGLKRQAGDIDELFPDLGYLEDASVSLATLGGQRQYFRRPRSVESHALGHESAHVAPPAPGNAAARPCRRLPRLDEDGPRPRLSRPSRRQHLRHRPGRPVSQQAADPEAQREGRARRDHRVQRRLRGLRSSPGCAGPRARRRRRAPATGGCTSTS